MSNDIEAGPQNGLYQKVLKQNYLVGKWEEKKNYKTHILKKLTNT